MCHKLGIRTYFGSVTVESVRFSCHFAFWRHVPRLATFSIVPKNCIFWGASFEPIQNLTTLVYQKVTRFLGEPPIPLLHPSRTFSKVCCITVHFRESDLFTYDMTHLYVTWLMYMWHDSCICDMTYLYVTWLIYVWHVSLACDMTHWHFRESDTQWYSRLSEKH